MNDDLAFAFVVFATATLFTPGPNNVMLLTSGLNFGVRRTLPHLAGVVLGFSTLGAPAGTPVLDGPPKRALTDPTSVASPKKSEARALSVPDLNVAEAYFNCFGLQVVRHADQLHLFTLGHPHCWGIVYQGTGLKKTEYYTVGVYAGALGFGTLQQGFLEASNVNAVAEITNLITAQRAYEMNSRVITTSDQMLSTLTNLR